MTTVEQKARAWDVFMKINEEIAWGNFLEEPRQISRDILLVMKETEASVVAADAAAAEGQ